MNNKTNLKNIILVSYDTTRADTAYSGKFHGIEKLRKNGISFKNCISSSPLTPVSHASVMTGLQPYHHGIRHLFREKLDKSCLTIASILSNYGYETSAVVSCPGLDKWYEIGRGFNHYDDEIPLLPDGSEPLQTVDVKLRGQALKRADLVTERSRQIFETLSLEKPYFHFIHFFDAHWPYDPPSFPMGEEISNPYEAEVAFVDYHFSQWFDWMYSGGRLKDTLIVLFGDHGEDLNGWYSNDKGGDELGHPEEMGHGCLLYDQTILVPLVFWHEGLEKKEISEQVRLIDIFPTIMDLLGIESPSKVDGESLFTIFEGENQINERVGYSETFYPSEQNEATSNMFEGSFDKIAVRIANQYKVIFQIGSNKVEAYDLASDPLEKENLIIK